ncbi:hypothetical protein BJY00DRAFT_301038 [Aspergillus carlsbadensis]|nr:hypothetical protein BJY00DRAFT_301038 [Aspergillus carlsbadensis]
MQLKYHISFLKKIYKLLLNSKINKIVFSRCCEFLYSGDYSIPLLVSNPLESDSGHSTNTKTLSQNVFHPAKLPALNAAIIPRLDHEALYKDRVVSLCAWSLYYLVYLLDNFTLFMERTSDIVQLLEFMFKDNYAVWNVEILIQDADF